MLSRQLIVIISLVIAAVIPNTVEGLQCYVCEDCNEYQDFKELSICGEITSEGVTQKPSTLPDQISVSSSTIVPESQLPATIATASSLKPPAPADNDDYLYEYSMEAHDDGADASGTDKKKTTKVPTDTATTTTNPTTTVIETTTIQSTTVPPPVSIIQSSAASSKPSSSSSSKPSSSASTAKPVQMPEDYDYMEYEDPRSFNIKSQFKGSNGSLLKIDEPVCYMYRYYANNTVFTNRGCTTLLNANKFLTCQTLSNGNPMVGCRICSTDGCNKYDLDESGEDYLSSAGIPSGAATIMIAFVGVMISGIF